MRQEKVFTAPPYVLSVVRGSILTPGPRTLVHRASGTLQKSILWWGPPGTETQASLGLPSYVPWRKWVFFFKRNLFLFLLIFFLF